MSNIKVDTSRLDSDAKRIIELSNQYLSLIDNMFNMMDTRILRAWSGSSSEKYRQILKNEKNFYVKFGNDLKSYGTELLNHSNRLYTVIRKWDNN